MFKFLRSRQAKKNRRSIIDLYELNEQETEMLMGGSPVRHLIGSTGNNTPHWQRTTNMGFNSTSYQPFTATPSQNTWQQAPSWVHVGEGNTTRWSNDYHE